MRNRPRTKCRRRYGEATVRTGLSVSECAPYLAYEEAKQAEYRAREVERSCEAYTENAKKRGKSVERLRKAGLL